MSNERLVFLLGKISVGDKNAFSEFYKEMEKPLYRFILSRFKDPSEVYDILHEVMMEVWRCAVKFEGRSTVKTWVFGIAYRKVMDRFRKSKRTYLPGELPEQIDESPDVESCIISAQESEHIMHCLQTLKPQHRMAIELAFFEDMNYKEIASIASVPEGTIKTRIFHAKKLLLRCLTYRLKNVAL